MKYVTRPIVVEAVAYDSPADALNFLEPGEFSVIRDEAVYLLTEIGTVRAHMGEHYLMRDSDGIHAVLRDIFESTYTTLDVSAASFTVCDEGEGVTLECSECGPIGTALSMEDIEQFAFSHMTDEHMGLS